MENQKQFETRIKIILRNIGDLVKTTREAKDMSMGELSKRSGVSSSVISDLENYKNIMPNILTLMKIANGLELPEEALMEKIWCNATRRNNDKELNVLNRLKTTLTEYGLPPTCMARVIDYIDYYKSINELETDYKIINEIYESEMNNGTIIDNVRLDPTIILEAKKNILRLEKIKAGLQNK